MISIKFRYCSLLALIFSFTVSAQTKPPANKPVKNGTITPITKFKPPIVKTFLGRNEKEATVSVDEATQLINLPLKIVDDKNIAYDISSYQFMYKKKSVVENEQSNKKEIVFTTVADRFKTTPLPKIWKDNIGGGIQKGEELFFFDIIVKDKLNRPFYAPNVKIIVK